MKYVIEGIKRYEHVEQRPHYSFLICMSQAMNILRYQSPLFEDGRTYDLIRIGWSSWFLPNTVALQPSYMLGQCFTNLQTLFGARVVTVPCYRPEQLRDLLRVRMPAGKPLFLFVLGKVRREGGRIHFIDEISNDGDGTKRHNTFVAHGFDSFRDCILLLNNHSSVSGWFPVGAVGERLPGKRAYEIRVPSNCEMPSRAVLAKLLLDRVRSNFETSGRAYPVGMEMLTHRNLPPAGTICGPVGIRAFADAQASYLSGHGRSIWEGNLWACKRILLMVQERGIFFSVLKEMLEGSNDLPELQGLSEAWDKLEKSWRIAAKLGTRVHETGDKDLVNRIQERFYHIAEEEERFLLRLKENLKDGLARSKGSEPSRRGGSRFAPLSSLSSGGGRNGRPVNLGYGTTILGR